MLGIREGVPSTAPLHEVHSICGLRRVLPRNHGGDGAPYAHNPTPCGPTGGSIACPTPLPKAEACPSLWRRALGNSNETCGESTPTDEKTAWQSAQGAAAPVVDKSCPTTAHDARMTAIL